MKNTIAKCTQREFGFTNWGGKRRGAGRKPKGRRAGVPHDKRPKLAKSKPVLVTQKVRLDVPSLRHPEAHAVVAGALAASTKGTSASSSTRCSSITCT